MNQLIEATLEDLVHRIETGTGDWIKEWISGGVPVNHVTSRQYHGVNILLLWAEKDRRRYPSNRWATYKQWQQAGFQVKGGERSATVFISKDALKKGGDKDNPADHYRLLRGAFVFNAAQLVEPPLLAAPPLAPHQKIEACELLVAACGATFEEGEPAYSTTHDKIRMLPIGDFHTVDAYYATVFHELVHWTGHKSRLDRDMMAFADDRVGYAGEELVAELGAAFLAATMELKDFEDNTASYLRGWLKRAGPDRGAALMKGASLASKAHEFIMSHVKQEELHEQAA